MKRSFIILAVFIAALLLGGCRPPQKIRVKTEGISLRAVIDLRESKYEGVFQRSNNGSSFEFMYPEALKGFSIRSQGGKVFLEYMGADQKLVHSSLGDAAFISQIDSCLGELENGSELYYKNEQLIYEGTANSKAFELIFSSAGLPVMLKMKSIDLTVAFYNY